jgi:hypothetical protein
MVDLSAPATVLVESGFAPAADSGAAVRLPLGVQFIGAAHAEPPPGEATAVSLPMAVPVAVGSKRAAADAFPAQPETPLGGAVPAAASTIEPSLDGTAACMPRADDLPSFVIDTTLTPCPSNPLGIKGCGEAGAIAAPPAVINAITDALGHEDIAMPASPQAVWRAAQKSVHKLAAE